MRVRGGTVLGEKTCIHYFVHHAQKNFILLRLQTQKRHYSYHSSFLSHSYTVYLYVLSCTPEMCSIRVLLYLNSEIEILGYVAFALNKKYIYLM